jgi:hypothetical protein
MVKVVQVVKKVRNIMSGSLNSLVTIQVRRITPPIGIDVNYSETFNSYPIAADVAALVQTSDAGLVVFDDTNTARNITHLIYIRYEPGITFENWLLYKGNEYVIHSIENLELESRFYLLKCSLRGDATKPVNLA